MVSFVRDRRSLGLGSAATSFASVVPPGEPAFPQPQCTVEGRPGFTGHADDGPARTVGRKPVAR